MTSYRSVVAAMALLLVLLGLGILVRTVVNGGGVGVVLGLLFVAAGIGRIWLMRRNR